jgi:hypothetical protein
MLQVWVQLLYQGIIASFKVWFEKKLLEWVLFEFDSSTHRDLTSKAGHYVVLSSVERDDSPNRMKQLEDVRDF